MPVGVRLQAVPHAGVSQSSGEGERVCDLILQYFLEPVYDRRNEFLGREFKNDLIENEYGIKSRCATTENPQANSLLERVFQMVENLVRIFGLQKTRR